MLESDHWRQKLVSVHSVFTIGVRQSPLRNVNRYAAREVTMRRTLTALAAAQTIARCGIAGRPPPMTVRLAGRRTSPALLPERSSAQFAAVLSGPVSMSTRNRRVLRVLRVAAAVSARRRCSVLELARQLSFPRMLI